MNRFVKFVEPSGVSPSIYIKGAEPHEMSFLWTSWLRAEKSFAKHPRHYHLTNGTHASRSGVIIIDGFEVSIWGQGYWVNSCGFVHHVLQAICRSLFLAVCYVCWSVCCQWFAVCPSWYRGGWSLLLWLHLCTIALSEIHGGFKGLEMLIRRLVVEGQINGFISCQACKIIGQFPAYGIQHVKVTDGHCVNTPRWPNAESYLA